MKLKYLRNSPQELPKKKINAENAAVIAENAVKAKQQFCQIWVTKYVHLWMQLLDSQSGT
jgi:hypothetical protein